MVVLAPKWQTLLNEEFSKEYYLKIREILKKEYLGNNNYRVFPPMNDIFNALRYTDYDEVKVVIIGQDPYHEYNQAHGLSFSVPDGERIPPSLVNIYKELESDLGIPPKKSGNLVNWAKDGVLLLNETLTVREGMAGSHGNIGWSIFTDKVVELLNEREKPMVFLLWGNRAKRLAERITNRAHLVLTSAHPSPLSASRGFFGCRHFSKANEFLKNNNIPPVNW